MRESENPLSLRGSDFLPGAGILFYKIRIDELISQPEKEEFTDEDRRQIRISALALGIYNGLFITSPLWITAAALAYSSLR